ncbi:hypothetical protein TcasGA2_TC001537 [Tribolium castaneum]|uniref:Uncharacterized protein n=1 Tax=Tribolium castaneum TaxID=7070 RepID=D7EI55_TRICA|nr:hypothetical protein TcasGA2_TC001537 [Tribolium castaneum]
MRVLATPCMFNNFHHTLNLAVSTDIAEDDSISREDALSTMPFLRRNVSQKRHTVFGDPLRRSKAAPDVGVGVTSGCDCGHGVCWRHECGGPGEIAPIASQKLCGDRVHGNSHTKREQAIRTAFATVLPTASFTRTPFYYRMSFGSLQIIKKVGRSK